MRKGIIRLFEEKIRVYEIVNTAIISLIGGIINEYN